MEDLRHRLCCIVNITKGGVYIDEICPGKREILPQIHSGRASFAFILLHLDGERLYGTFHTFLSLSWLARRANEGDNFSPYEHSVKLTLGVKKTLLPGETFAHVNRPKN